MKRSSYLSYHPANSSRRDVLRAAAAQPVGLALDVLPEADSCLLGLRIAVENVLGPVAPPCPVSRD